MVCNSSEEKRQKSLFSSSLLLSRRLHSLERDVLILVVCEKNVFLKSAGLSDK